LAWILEVNDEVQDIPQKPVLFMEAKSTATHIVGPNTRLIDLDWCFSTVGALAKRQ